MADRIITVAYNIQAKGDVGAVTKLEKVRKSGKGAAKQVTGLGKSFEVLQRSARFIDGPLGGVAARFETLNAASRSTSGLLFGVIAAISSAGLAFRTFVRRADQLQQVRNQLRLVTDGANDLAAAEERLFQVARDTRVSVQATISTYARLARSTKELNLTGTELTEVTKAINQAVTLSGTTAASASAALFQLGQGLAANRLSGQELNSVLEQTPRLAEALTEGLGIARGELKKFAEEGNITAAAFVRAMQSQAGVLDKEFAKTVPTVSQAAQALSDAFTKIIGKADSATAASTLLAKSLLFLADNLETVVTVITVSALAALGALVVKFGIATKAAALFLAANPIYGLLALAIVAVSVAITKLNERQADLTRAVGKSDSAFDKLVGLYRDLKGATGEYRKELLDLIKTQEAVAETTARTALQAVRSGLAAELTNSVIEIGNLESARLRFVRGIEKSIKVGDAAAEGAQRNQLDRLVGRLADLRKAQDTLNEQVRKSVEGVTRVSTAKNVADKLDEKGRIKELSDAFKDLVEGNRSPFAKYEARLKEIAEIRSSVTRQLTREEAIAFENAARSAKDELVKALGEGKDEIPAIYDEIARDIKDTFSDTFADLIRDGEISFKSFGRSIKDIFADVLGQLATQALARPVIIPVVQSVGGLLGASNQGINAIAQQLGGSGQLGPNTDATGTGLASLASFGKSLFSGAGFNQGAAAFATKIFGAGGSTLPSGFVGAPSLTQTGVGNAAGLTFSPAGIAGGFIGNFGANALFGGDRGIGASIGGAAGGVAGGVAGSSVGLGFTAALVPALGPLAPVVGPLLGSFLGNSLGGLFGSKPSNKFQTAGIDLTSGAIANRDGFSGKKFSQENFDAVTALSDFTVAVSQALDVTDKFARVSVGSRDGLDFFLADTLNAAGERSNATNVASANELVKVIATQLNEAAPEFSESLATALSNINFDDLEQAQKDIGFAILFDNLNFLEDNATQLEKALEKLSADFKDARAQARRLGLDEQRLIDLREEQLSQLRDTVNQNVQNRILQITNPRAAALNSLNQQFVQIRRDAVAAGADLVDVERLYALERQQILEDSLQEQSSLLSGTYAEIEADLRGIRNRLLLSEELGGGSRFDRAQNAQSVFENLQSRIRRGEGRAFEELDRTTQDYLQASLDYYGPTEQYLARLEDVFKLLDEADSIAKSTLSVEDNILNENQTQSGLLQQLVDQGNAVSKRVTNLSGISAGQLLREGETLEGINSRINPLNNLNEALVRKLKVSASGGAFNFSTAGGSFADFVRAGNRGAGESFLDLLEAFGGQGFTQQKQNFGFFASGTGNAAFSGLGVVGEQGPEMVNFGRPAQIFSNGDTQGLASLGALPASFDDFRRQSARETEYMGGKMEAFLSEMRELREEVVRMRQEQSA